MQKKQSHSASLPISQIAEGQSGTVRALYDKWFEFMEEEVDFSLKDSKKHTKSHCARVLLYSLMLAEKLGLGKEEMESLSKASVFHDSRRHDDWHDVGHGGRAAIYYRDYCESHGIQPDERTALVMAYHDQDDELGIQNIGAKLGEDSVLLYKIFKDADALDRFRLCPGAFHEKYLRTAPSQDLIPFAKDMVQRTSGSRKGNHRGGYRHLRRGSKKSGTPARTIPADNGPRGENSRKER